MHYHFTNRVQSSTFLRAIQHSDYTDTITTLQSHMNSYPEDYNTGFLPPHLHLHGLAESIHLNAQARLRDIAVPHIQRLDYGCSLVQGIPPPPGPHSPSINRLGCPERNGVGFCDNNWDGNDGGGDQGARERTHNGRDSYCGIPDVRGQADRSRTPKGCPVARPDCNRCQYLPDVQCAACKWVGHVAKHCNMLAMAICLERYLKNDLSTLVQDTIERDWLAK
jgi:hypothetical protein